MLASFLTAFVNSLGTVQGSIKMTVMTDTSLALPIVQADSFLTLHYRVTLVNDGAFLGDFLNTFDEKPATLLMGSGQLAPALESALIGLEQGTHTTIELPAGAAFGDRNPEMLQRVGLKLLKAEAEMGTQFEVGDLVEFNAAKGRMAGTIVGFDDEAALMDFNHPLAGQAVAFEVKLIAVL
jgi:FKBP-type peptidyl-prolyl cis-trans isomerase SlpA